MKLVSTLCCFLALAISMPVLLAQDTSCLNQLIPCLAFINSKKTPTSSCCDPLKSLIKSDPKCLCNMLGGTSTARQAGVNMTRAQHLPARCGEKVTAASCTSSPKTKTTTLTSSSGELPIMTAGVVALLAIAVQCVWGLCFGFVARI